MSKHAIPIIPNAGASASGLRCEDFLQSIDPPQDSAIDQFYSRARIILNDASRPNLHPELSALFAVGMIAAAEAYLREIIVGLVSFCPCVQKRCKSEEIKIGAFSYYGENGIGFSLADSISFSNASTIEDRIRLLSGVNSKLSADLTVALREFSKICNLRHSLVHACGLLSYHHFEAMSLAESSHPTYAKVDFPGIQVIAAVCYNLVRMLNSTLFNKTTDDWIDNSVVVGNWNNDKNKFTSLIDLFVSRVDRGGRVNAYSEWRKIRKILMARNS